MLKNTLQSPSIDRTFPDCNSPCDSYFAPLIAPHSPDDMNPAARFAERSAEYPLGGDQLGRCEFSRLVYGARLS